MNNEDRLKNAGFTYHPERVVWINRDRRMAFSDEAVADSNSGWIQERLDKTVADGEFWFWYSIIPPNFKEICWDVLAELGMSNLRPMVPV